MGCPGSRVSQDCVGTSTCGLGRAGRNGVKWSGSTGCSGMRTLRSKPGAWYSGTVWILSFSKENQSNRNTCKMPQFSTQHSDLQRLLSARKILLAKGGTAWTSVPAFPKAHVYLPLGWLHLPARRACPPLRRFPSLEQLCAGTGRQRVPRWGTGLPPALRRRHAPRAALLLSFSSGSQFYCAIKLLPPLRDKPARRRRARITLDQ